MKYRRLIALVPTLALFLLVSLLPSVARAQTATPTATATATATATPTVTATPSATPTPMFVNRMGTAQACVPVGTSTPVVILDVRKRCAWHLAWAEATNLSCAPIAGNPGDTTPLFTPTSTRGALFTTPLDDHSITGSPNYGWSCVAVTTTANVCSVEEINCDMKGNFN